MKFTSITHLLVSSIALLNIATSADAKNLRAGVQSGSPSPHHTDEQWRHLTSCDSSCSSGGATGQPVTGLSFQQLNDAVKDYMSDPNSSPYGNIINCWNIQQTSLEGAFYNLADFNEPIGCWDVSEVTNFSAMFSGATKFNQDISGWDVSKGTTFQDMFYNQNYGTGDFNQDISGWDVSAATTMEGFLFGAYSFNQNLCSWGPKLAHITDQTALDSMFLDSGCPATSSPVVGQTLNSWCQHCFGNYNGYWNATGSNAGQSYTAGSSWTQGQSSTYTDSFTASMTFSATESAEFDGTGLKTTESATLTMQTSVSNTMSYAETHDWSYTCSTPTCDNGVIFQWIVEADYSDGTTQYVKTCNFECVPQSIPNGKPQCPLTYCSDITCQCCNADWIDGNTNPNDNHLEDYNGNGGTCKDFCVGDDQPCYEGVTCCSGSCSSSGICEYSRTLEQTFRM